MIQVKLLCSASPWPLSACGCLRATARPTAAHRLRSERSKPRKLAEKAWTENSCHVLPTQGLARFTARQPFSSMARVVWPPLHGQLSVVVSSGFNPSPVPGCVRAPWRRAAPMVLAVPVYLKNPGKHDRSWRLLATAISGCVAYKSKTGLSQL